MKPPRHHRIPPLQRDEAGKPLCRNCQQPVPKPRRTFCSDQCVEDQLVRSNPSWARTALHKRDKGICAACGRDSDTDYRAHLLARREAIRCAERLYYAARHDMEWTSGQWIPKPFPFSPKQTGQMRRALIDRLAPPNPGWTQGRSTGWDADHITPVERGGGSCGLENLQTLCHPCHKAKTAKQAADKAAARRQQQAKPVEAQLELF